MFNRQRRGAVSKHIRRGMAGLHLLLAARLFLLPFWDMVGGVSTYPQALRHSLRTTALDFYWGGIDQVGTVWVFTMAKGIFSGNTAAS